MSPTIASLGLDKLTIEERIALAGELWESVEAERVPNPLTDEFRAELHRRAEDAILNPDDGIPWEEVKAKGRLRIGQ